MSAIVLLDVLNKVSPLFIIATLSLICASYAEQRNVHLLSLSRRRLSHEYAEKAKQYRKLRREFIDSFYYFIFAAFAFIVSELMTSENNIYNTSIAIGGISFIIGMLYLLVGAYDFRKI